MRNNRARYNSPVGQNMTVLGAKVLLSATWALGVATLLQTSVEDCSDMNTIHKSKYFKTS